MEDNMMTDEKTCTCEGCPAHMEGEMKGECNCDAANCNCEMCGKGEMKMDEAPAA